MVPIIENNNPIIETINEARKSSSPPIAIPDPTVETIPTINCVIIIPTTGKPKKLKTINIIKSLAAPIKND